MNALATLSGPQAAAVFVMLLDDGEAARLLAHLQPDELAEVGATMCELGDIDSAQIQSAIGSFVAEADREIIPAGDRGKQVRNLLGQAVGDMKAESMMQRIASDNRPRALEIARWLVPSVTAKLIGKEHPQVISVLLLMLEPENAAAVLALLPEEMQPLVVERIARLGPVTSDAVAMLDTLLSAQISTQFGAAVAKIGGPREAANLINLAAGDTAKRVLPKIGEANAELASKIEAEMFTFEMLFDLSGLDMGRLLRDVDNEALVDALKGLEADKREPFFAAMSSRAADGVRDDIELRGRLKREEVDAAQKSIVEIARGLADQGEITIGGGGDEFV
jgi:flagellar motor switch protein FliG